MYILILAKQHLDLAQAEAIAQAGPSKRYQDLLITKNLPQGLALSKSAWQVIWSGSLGNFRLETPLAGSFAVRSHNVSQTDKELAALVWQELERHGIKPKVDLRHPENLLRFFKIEDTCYAATLAWTAESFEPRKAHRRPHNHPTSLHPKLARAMINLAGKTRTILDPFCGSGGILLEGALIGKQMMGTDIDPIQIRRAQDNLAAFSQSAMLTIADAANCAALGPVDAIVTDFPLGRNAKLPDSDFSRFFTQASHITKRMVIGTVEEYRLDLAPWRIKQEFTWYIHKSMTKKILVLTLQAS